MQAGALSSDDRLKLGIIFAVFAVDAAWIVVAGYGFDFVSLIRPVVVVSFLLAVAELYRHWRPNPVFVVMTRETAWLIAFSIVGATLSTLVITLDMPLIDDQLAAFDRALGLDWQTYYTYVTARPALGFSFALLYFIALPMTAFAVIGLSIMGRTDRASELVLAAMIGALMAILVSGVFPSSGALAYFRPDETALAHGPIVDLAYKQTFFDLRADGITSVSLDGMKGLIAFPSYHAALNVIAVLAFRGMPRVFWPLLVLTVAMLVTTPVQGGHHFVDAIGGSLVAVISVWLAALLRKRLRLCSDHSLRNGMKSVSASPSRAT